VYSLFSLLLHTRIWLKFRLGTWLITDAWRASIEVNGEKLAEQNNGWSLVFNKQDGSHEQDVSSEGRGKSSGLEMFLSQGNRPVARKTLANIWPFAARFYAFPNSSPLR